LPWADRLSHYARMLEAIALLLWARLLVALVPMRYWRGSLGTMAGGGGAAGGPSTWRDVPRDLRIVARVVERAAARLPVHFKCLPRAMAVQWMARRRGLACTLRIGLARGAGEPLHAWVDHGQVTVIGERPDQKYSNVMAFISERR
jgi:hypothetical protein